MPHNDEQYLIEYKRARARFSGSFLLVFDQLVQNMTPGLGTLLTTVTMPLIGIAMIGTYSYLKNQLYTNLIIISNDSQLRAYVDQENCIQLLASRIITIDDLPNIPAQSRSLFFSPNTLRAIQEDDERIKHLQNTSRTQVRRLENELKLLGRADSGLEHRLSIEKDELEQLKTVMERIRESGYSSTSISLISRTQTNTNRMFTSYPPEYNRGVNRMPRAARNNEDVTLHCPPCCNIQ